MLLVLARKPWKHNFEIIGLTQDFACWLNEYKQNNGELFAEIKVVRAVEINVAGSESLLMTQKEMRELLEKTP
jgi:hypothetical protein